MDHAPTRNVWSAALSQAKNESDGLVCANVFGLCWSRSSWPGWNALRSRSPFSYAVLEGLLPSSGLESAGFDRCAISWFASRPGRKSLTSVSSRWSVDVGIAHAISKPGLSQAPSAGQSGCQAVGQHRRPIGFTLGQHGPGHARQLIGQRHADDVAVGARCELRQPRTQTGRLLRLCCRTARAPCTNSFRK